jgi:hypothetical protein
MLRGINQILGIAVKIVLLGVLLITGGVIDVLDLDFDA